MKFEEKNKRRDCKIISLQCLRDRGVRKTNKTKRPLEHEKERTYKGACMLTQEVER